MQNMRLGGKQQGLGWFGLVYILGTLGFAVFLVLKCQPIYMNEMKLQRAVQRVASEFDTTAATENPNAVRDALQKWWNVEDIEKLEPKDIKIKTTPTGKALSYDYWNQAELFNNVFLSFHFAKDRPLKGAN